MKHLCAIIFLCLSASISWAVPLFQNGSTVWCILLSDKFSPAEQFAVEELQRALKKISGVDFPAVNKVQQNTNVIYVGTPQSSEHIRRFCAELHLTDGDVEEVSIKTHQGNLYLAGNNPRGCLYAVYTFLQKQLRVRWLWGGEDGEFIPRKNTYELPVLDYFYRPCFPLRSVGGFDGKYGSREFKEFSARNFRNFGCNWFQKEHHKYGFIKYGCCHSVCLHPKLYEKHPDMFCLIDGKRIPERDSRGCYSNPKVLDYMVKKHVNLIKRYGLDCLYAYPSDNGHYCRCPECEKNPDVSSRWFRFYATLCKRLKEQFPKMTFFTIGYQEYAKPPLENVDPIISLVDYCQYDRCYVHKLEDPNCKINATSLKRLKTWLSKSKCGIYGYEFDIFDPIVYPPFLNMLADELRVFKKLGIRRVYAEGVSKRPGQNLVNLRMPTWIYSRLAWNPDLKVDDLLTDWCRTVYGPAADPIIECHRIMLNAWDHMDTHLTYVFNDPMGTSKYLMNQSMIETFHRKLSEAGQILMKLPVSAERKRRLQCLDKEKMIFANWEKAYTLSNNSISLVSAPLTDKHAEAALLPLSSPHGTHQKTVATVHYDRDHLYFKVVCHEDEMDKLIRSSNNCFGRDSIELMLDPKDGNSYRHLAFGLGGKKYFAVAGRVQSQADWDYDVKEFSDRWVTYIRIPFATIGVVPKAGNTWTLVLNRNGNMKGGAKESCGYPKPLYNDISTGGVLHFTDKIHPERRLIWFNTLYDGRFGSKASFPALMANGWSFRMGNPELRKLDDYEVILIRTIKNKLPLDYYHQVILPRINRGAVLVFDAYSGVNFGKIFQDYSWNLQFKGTGFVTPKEGRVLDHPFNHGPFELSQVIKYAWQYPVNCHLPKAHKAWIPLAELKTKNGQWEACMLMRRYGKGLVVVSGAMAPATTVPVISNALHYHKSNR